MDHFFPGIYLQAEVLKMCERYMEALTFVCPPAHSAGSDVTLELLMT